MQAWNAHDYALLDFGMGRKLECFGGIILDRPSPAAEGLSRALCIDWSGAGARLGEDGNWAATHLPEKWQSRFGEIVFNLKLTPFGHVGLFPEQASNWQWLASQAAMLQRINQRSVSALNLFAYTGGTTLALSVAGARVVHVDASAPAVKWARLNALDSQLSERPIRWIVEDARKFAARELRRGNSYDMIVLDPPSYGHGPGGRQWSIEQDLKGLLVDCVKLLSLDCAVLLLTAHSDSRSEAALVPWIERALPDFDVHHDRLNLGAASERQLDAGFVVRATKWKD